MTISICPLSADWGNVAEWTGVLAALVVGFAVWLVSKRTNRLGEEANTTNRNLEHLEQAREAAAAERSIAERRVLLVSMHPALRIGGAYLSIISESFHSATFTTDFAHDANLRDKIVSYSTTIGGMLSTLPVDRAYHLGEQLGARTARASKAAETVLKVMAQTADVDDAEGGDADGAPMFMTLAGEVVRDELLLLETDVSALLQAANDALRETQLNAD